MKYRFIVFLLFLQSICFSQSWQWSRQIGGSGFDNAQISYIDAEQNVYIWGNYASNAGGPPLWTGQNCQIGNQTLIGIQSSFIAKYDKNGVLTWVRNLAPKDYSLLYIIQYDSLGGNFILSGGFEDSINLPGFQLEHPGNNQFLAKMNSDGICTWAKNLGCCCYILSLAPDSHGNIYVAGRTLKPTTIDTCLLSKGDFIAKFNSSGKAIWAKTICSSDNPYFDIRRLTCYQDQLYTMGYTQGYGTLTLDTISIEIQYGQNAIGIFCLDSLAHGLWFKVDGSPYAVVGENTCFMTSTGNMYLLSSVLDTVVFGSDTLPGQGYRKIVAKYNSDGNLLAVNQIFCHTDYNGLNGYSLYAQNDGTYYIATSFSGTAVIGEYYLTAYKDPDILLAKFNDAGECLGAEHLGGGQGTSVYPGSDGVYITGVFSPLPSDTGTITVGNQTYHTYGYEDIIFAKHDLMTGTKETRRNDNSLVIYANPNKGSFRVKIPNDIVNSSSLVLTIYNNQGTIIHSTRFAPQGESPQINLFGKPAGIYPVTISNGKKTYTGKLVVE
jgi:hypothetical protein